VHIHDMMTPKTCFSNYEKDFVKANLYNGYLQGEPAKEKGVIARTFYAYVRSIQTIHVRVGTAEHRKSLDP